MIIEIKKYKSIIKEKKKKHDKKVMLGKDNFSAIEVLISKALVDSYITKFMKFMKYYEMKKEIKNPETSMEYII